MPGKKNRSIGSPALEYSPVLTPSGSPRKMDFLVVNRPLGYSPVLAPSSSPRKMDFLVVNRPLEYFPVLPTHRPKRSEYPKHHPRCTTHSKLVRKSSYDTSSVVNPRFADNLSRHPAGLRDAIRSTLQVSTSGSWRMCSQICARGSTPDHPRCAHCGTVSRSVGNGAGLCVGNQH